MGAFIVRGVVKQRCREEILSTYCRSRQTRLITICNHQHMNGAFLVGGRFGSGVSFCIANVCGTAGGRRLRFFGQRLYTCSKLFCPVISG